MLLLHDEAGHPGDPPLGKMGWLMLWTPSLPTLSVPTCHNAPN